MADIPHVVIIGGGFGGLDAARGLRDAPVRVTLIDRHNYHLFQPLLYQVAAAALSPADVASPIRWILRKQRNVQVLLGDVQSIDPNRRIVRYRDGSAANPPTHASAAAASDTAATGTVDVPSTEPGSSEEGHVLDYDYLIVAIGARHSYFGHSNWATRAPGLKTLDDALEIRREVLLAFEAAERETDLETRKRLLTFVIVGGGPTGVELAGALAEIAKQSLVEDFRSIHPESASVILIEGGPHVLPTFPESLRRSARAALERLGVDVKTSAIVTDVTPTGVCVGSETIAAETVLWAAGVATSPLMTLIGAPVDRAGRVLTEPTLRVPGHPEVFAVGDACALQQDGKPLPGVAQVAMQGGAHAAKNVLRAIRGEPLLPFRYRNYGSVATIGRGAAVVDLGRFKMSGFPAWVFWLFLHIFWLIGFRNRIAVMGEWAWAYITFQRRARLITGERLSPGPRQG